MQSITNFTEMDRTRFKSIYDEMFPHIDEKTKRLLGAAMVKTLGHGGQTVIRELTGLSPDTLQLGVQQLNQAGSD